MFEQLYFAIYDYILATVNFNSYEAMTEEKRKKLIEKVTILTCMNFSPRKNYDIGKDEIRHYVSEIMEIERKLFNDESAKDQLNSNEAGPSGS